MVGVDVLEEIELRPLVVPRDALWPGKIENGRARRTEEGALVAGRQKTCAPVERTTLHALAVAEHDVTGKVLAFAPQTVGYPRAGARKTRAGDARVDLVKRRHMIV